MSELRLGQPVYVNITVATTELMGTPAEEDLSFSSWNERPDMDNVREGILHRTGDNDEDVMDEVITE